MLIVFFLAFVVPLVLSRFKRLRLPVVVGEILAGIVVGQSSLGLVGHDPILEILALLGFGYLMFFSGLEVDFDAILPKPGTWQGSWQERLGNPLSLGVLAFRVFPRPQRRSMSGAPLPLVWPLSPWPRAWG